MNTLRDEKRQVKRLSLKSVGFANTSAGTWPTEPLVADRLRESSVNQLGQWIQLCYLTLKHISYSLVPWGVKLAAIVFTHFYKHNVIYVFTLFRPLCFSPHMGIFFFFFLFIQILNQQGFYSRNMLALKKTKTKPNHHQPFYPHKLQLNTNIQKLAKKSLHYLVCNPTK